MGIDINNIGQLNQVSNISSLYVDDGGQLRKHSLIGELCHKIGDAFRSLSENGRAEIARRTEQLYDQFQVMVENVRVDQSGNAGLHDRIRMLDTQLKEAVAAQQNDFLNRKLPGIMSSHPNLAGLENDDKANAEAFIRDGFKGMCKNGINKALGDSVSQCWQWGNALEQLADMYTGKREFSFDLENSRELAFLTRDIRHLADVRDRHPEQFTDDINNGMSAMLKKDRHTLKLPPLTAGLTPDNVGDKLKEFLDIGELNEEYKTQAMHVCSSLITDAGLDALANGMPAKLHHVNDGMFKDIGFQRTDRNAQFQLRWGENNNLHLDIEWTSTYQNEEKGHTFTVKGSTSVRLEGACHPSVGNTKIQCFMGTHGESGEEYFEPNLENDHA